MTDWTESARAALDRYLEQARSAAAASGADPDEVVEDLRRHIEQKLAESGARVATHDDLTRVLAGIGTPPVVADDPPAVPPRIILACSAPCKMLSASGWRLKINGREP